MDKTEETLKIIEAVKNIEGFFHPLILIRVETHYLTRFETTTIRTLLPFQVVFKATYTRGPNPRLDTLHILREGNWIEKLKDKNERRFKPAGKLWF